MTHRESEPRLVELSKDETCLAQLPACKYSSDGYYNVKIVRNQSGWRLDLTYERFEKPLEKSYVGRLFEDHIMEPHVFVATVSGNRVGWIELGYERWNNRVRVWEFLVAEESRRKGVGKLLMNRAVAWARERGARMLVLETQSNNSGAVGFYVHFGFELIGFDLAAYSNDDVGKREVHLEFGLKL